MNVELRIQEISLRGIPVRRSDLPILRQAICDRLQMQLQRVGDPSEVSDALASLANVEICAPFDPTEFGQDLGGSLCSGGAAREGGAADV